MYFITNEVLTVKEKMLPKEIMKIRQDEIKTFKKPYCDQSTKLPFSMGTFDHLDSVQSKDMITMPPEAEMIGSLLVEPENYFGHLVFKALQQVKQKSPPSLFHLLTVKIKINNNNNKNFTKEQNIMDLFDAGWRLFSIDWRL